MADPVEGPPAPPPPPATDGAAQSGGRQPIDRIGQLLAKSFDLAEAGISLGLTLVETVGGVAHHRLLGIVEPPPPAAPPPPAPALADAPRGGITNRTPLAPGAPVSVSFSINNDSPTRAWDVSLAVEPFVGQRTGATLPPGALAVAPSAARVAPMDFEKFVLRGAIPPETPPDIYDGHVCGDASAGVRIPVRLVVEAQRVP